MQIRRPAPDELVAKVFPLRWYAFEPSPPEPGRVAESERFVRYTAADHTLVAEEGDQVLAVATGISMRQNLRGTVHPMAGVAGVASHPLARRRGHVRALLNRLLGEMRDSGHPLSALYPFRPSFYQRFGYVGLPAERTASFAPADLRPFLDADLDGELHWERIGTGHEAFRTFTGQLLARRHGFAVHPAHRATLPGDLDQSWLVTARVAGAVVAATRYRIAEHGG
ncbi:MAG TPA: GNAT family N-acetyltransferase, partial [Micromonospora sp.]